MKLTAASARALHLHAQGLLTTPRRRARMGDVRDAIKRMQLLQIDTISVVARSPYLVLFSRLGSYDPAWLDEALAGGVIFETWAHEACFAPMADYALLRAHLAQKGHHWALRHAERQAQDHRDGMRRVLERIRAEGPLRSSDFDAGARAGGWWGWKDEKRWLEALFARGDLMVARRDRFQRVYDLTGRVLAHAGVAADAAATAWTAADVRRALVERSIRALGIARAEWIADYYRLRPRVRDEELSSLEADGRVQRVQVTGWPTPAFVHRDHADALDRAASCRLRATATTLLSPFDPVVWDRDRALALFGFAYRIECYVSAPKRQYGYYVLPILHRGRLVGRLDAKMHRGQALFEVKALHFEADVVATPTQLREVSEAITRCARWHCAERIRIGKVVPRGCAAELKAAIRTALATGC